MQLVKNKPCQEVLEQHLSSANIPLFLKSLEEDLVQFLSSAFEVSFAWLEESSAHVTEANHNPSLEALGEYLLHSKQRGLQPKVIFLKSEASNDRSPILLIELSKMTTYKIPFTAFKQWDYESFEEVLPLCHGAGLYCRGVFIPEAVYERLSERRLMPVIALKEALTLWKLEPTVQLPVNLLNKISPLSQKIRYISIQPTRLGTILS